jgi:hypothetical protein
MTVLAEEFHAVDVNISLTLLGTMLGLFPVLLGGTPEQAGRIFAPFAAGQGALLAAFALSEPGGSANFAAPAPAEGRQAPEEFSEASQPVFGPHRPHPLLGRKFAAASGSFGGGDSSLLVGRERNRRLIIGAGQSQNHMGNVVLRVRW